MNSVKYFVQLGVGFALSSIFYLLVYFDWLNLKLGTNSSILFVIVGPVLLGMSRLDQKWLNWLYAVFGFVCFCAGLIEFTPQEPEYRFSIYRLMVLAFAAYIAYIDTIETETKKVTIKQLVLNSFATSAFVTTAYFF